MDERDGIAPGRHWRDELARALRTSDAIVFLGSSRSERSVWCAAELAVAKTLEKDVVPVQLEGSARHPLLDDEQWVVYRGDLAETIRRLVVAVRRRPGTDAHRHRWDDNRAPFPGLSAFDLADAGVYFGRDAFISELVSVVDPVSALDHSSLVAVVGPSGVGKSSLVRAGLAAALLDRPGERWLIVPPVVPALDTRREFARALVAAGLDADAADNF